jgi:DNA-binding transcriptional ArsR family regulator
LRAHDGQNILSAMRYEPAIRAPGEPEAARGVEIIADVERAAILLRDPRRRILELARSPLSAVEMAESLDEPRQRVGYHVRVLAEAGLLEGVDVARRGAMVEKRYRASAGAYALAPDLLGPLAARMTPRGDRESLVHLLGAVHEVQTDVARVLAARASAAGRLPTLTLSSRIRLRDAAERGAFAEALVRALADAVAAHTAPFEGSDGAAGEGEPFRLTLTLHPTSEP